MVAFSASVDRNSVSKIAQADNSQTDSVISVARQVFEMSTLALTKQAEQLDEQFIKAVELIEKAKGKLVVTGIGKSGHIGNKIAATFASTGTSAFFVHANEASHGDLGMIGQNDVVLALSNSGRTSELTDIIAYTRRFAIPLIAMTAEAQSPLAEQSDVTLQLIKYEEACPLGLAPTTSSTLCLVLGDALAMALLKRRGFSTQDFHLFHPGGKLGQQLKRVSDLMHGGDMLPTSLPDQFVGEALLEMTRKGFGCTAVIDPETKKLIGIVTDGDLRRHMGEKLIRTRVKDIMTISPRVIYPEQLAQEALRIMNEKAITSLFVVDQQDMVVGILHIHDCLRAGIA